jgi:hypothetical protein
MLTMAVKRVAEGGELRTTAQSEDLATYYSRPSADEWASFARASWRTVELRDLTEILAKYLPGSSHGSGRSMRMI